MCVFLQLIHFSVVVFSLLHSPQLNVLTVTLQLFKRAIYCPDSKFQPPPPQSHMTTRFVLGSQPPFTSICSFLSHVTMIYVICAGTWHLFPVSGEKYIAANNGDHLTTMAVA